MATPIYFTQNRYETDAKKVFITKNKLEPGVLKVWVTQNRFERDAIKGFIVDKPNEAQIKIYLCQTNGNKPEKNRIRGYIYESV